MSDLVDEHDLRALRAVHAQQPAPRGAARRGAVQQRRDAERRGTAKPIADNDGRKLRATGRTEQLGLRVTPEVKALIALIQRERRMTVASIVEAAIKQYADGLSVDAGTN